MFPFAALFLFIAFSLPAAAIAEVSITELMYDLPGSDSGREWIEVENAGSEAVDIFSWKLFEANTNHTISTTSQTGLLALPPRGYAIIADDPQKFLVDWPGFSGLLFGSSFSLNNSGEALSLKDANGAVVDSVTFDGSMGAAGDGSALLRFGSTFVATAPTPGYGSAGTEENNTSQTTSDGPPRSSSSVPVYSNGSVAPVAEPEITADAGGDRLVVVGADTLFDARAFGLKHEPLENARFIWNFGNGVVKEGAHVFMRYDYPGEYVAVLTIASGKYSASDRMQISAVIPDIVISEANRMRIVLWNKTNRDLDISNWILFSGAQSFRLPLDTVILANRKVAFTESVTGLAANDLLRVSLNYPNGLPAVSYLVPPTSSAPIFPDASAPAAPASAVSSSAAVSAAIVNAASPDDPPVVPAPKRSRSFFPWLVGLVVIIALGVAAVLFLGERKDDDDIAILEG